jgi:hypothetical protein
MKKLLIVGACPRPKCATLKKIERDTHHPQFEY